MTLIFQLIVIFLCLLMFRVNIKWKLPILLFSLAFFSSVTISFIPYGSTFYIVPISFFFSEFFHFKKNLNTLKKSLVYKLIVLQIIATLIYYVNSPHYVGWFDQFLRLCVGTLISSYFILVYSYCSIQNRNAVKCLSKAVFYSALLLAIIGVVNYLFHRPVFLELISNNVLSSDVLPMDDNSVRFRVQSTYINPFDYGYMCLMLVFFALYLYQNKYMTRKKFLVIALSCLFGVLFCNCRTILICMLLGMGVFVLTAYKGRTKFKNIVVIISVLILAYAFVPVVQDKVNQSLTAFTDTGGQQVSGSNLDMRAMQFARVLFHIQGHELFGRGVDYFGIDMGWLKYGNADETQDSDLAGLEGLYLSYLLERGIVGLSIWIFFNVTLIVYFIKRLKMNRNEASLGLTILTIYILFANMTGELRSLAPTLLFLGVLMKIIDSSSTNKTLKIETKDNGI